MNKELQTAYNEWLLKYGFNPVSVQQIDVDNMYHLVSLMHDYKPDDLLKRTAYPLRIAYQLKTPEELKDD